MLNTNSEYQSEPKKKLKDSKKPRKKNSQKNTHDNSSKYFEQFHPSVKEGLETLNELYSSFITNFSAFQPNPLNIFDPELMAKTFSETHQVMMNTYVVNPDKWDEKQKNYLNDLDELYQRTIDRFQGQEVDPIIIPEKGDRRFKASEWEELPVFDYLKQAYLLHSKYIRDMVESLDGINPKTKEKAQFYIRSLLDAASPTNSPFTNPEVLRETLRTQGQNLARGYQKLLDDNANSNFLSLPMFTNLKEFEVGKNLGTTKGKVVYETPLFQLLYYQPTTEMVYERPLLIIPPWINKYYIFDLQEENSFIKWALNKGLSVFVLSWINPDETYADCGFGDYVLDGVLHAIEVVLSISGQDKLNIMAQVVSLQRF